MGRRIGRISGWPHWCGVCEREVRCKGDEGCKENPACTSWWEILAPRQRLEREAAPVDPAYEAAVWPPEARRKPRDEG